MMSQNETNLLRKRAKKFEKLAKFCLRNNDFDLAVFNSEQAVQLLLKTFLLEQQGWYPKTHSIFELLNLCGKFKSGMKNFIRKERLAISLLEDSYITSRYVAREFTKEEAEEAIRFMKRLKGVLE